MAFRVRVLVGLSGLLLGCAHSTIQAPAPTVRNSGVALSVVSGQRCFVTRDNERLPPPTNDNRVHVRVTLRIENDSPEVVGVTSGDIRLAPRVPARAAQGEIAPIGSTELTLLPGQSQVFPLDFAGPGPVDCRHPFDLEPRGAVTRAARPVTLAPIRLVASR